TPRKTSPMGRASKRCARERMVSQETMANTMERTSNKKKVRRQSSLWRRSNCSRRSDTAAGRPAPDDKRLDGSTTFLLLLMDSRGDYTLANIVGTVLTHQQYKPSGGVPDGYL